MTGLSDSQELMPNLGPDAQRYLMLASGAPVTRPFHLRWLLPRVCGRSLRRWWIVYCSSWVVLAVSMAWFAKQHGLSGWTLLAAVLLLLGLPGILGPQVSIPVQVDLPATALTLLSVCCISSEMPSLQVAGYALLIVAACCRETAAVFAALWAWSFWPLLVLIVPTLSHLVCARAEQTNHPEWDWIAAHPLRAGIQYHLGRWRDAKLLLLPWGACIFGLYELNLWVCVVVLVAYAQLLVATDSVRLYQHGAGPVLALATAALIPVPWIAIVLLLHWLWIVPQERI